jgi:hypothetical protein
MNTAEQLRAEGEAKGRAEGEAKGRAEGRAAVLLDLLTSKFGPLSPESQARVEGASLTELGQWARRVLTATNLEDVFR